MKYFAALLAVVGLVSAQSLSDIPSCAQSCIASAVTNATTCGATDYKCICDNENAVVASATSCVIQACGASVATGQVLPATEKFCSAVEAGSSISGSSTSGSASGSASAPSSSSAVATTTATTTVTSAMTSSMPAATTTTSMTAMGNATTTSASASKSASGTTSASVSAVTTGGAAVMGSVGGLAMLALGALAAF